MAVITVQELGPNGDGFTNLTFTSLTAATNTFTNDGQIIIFMKNDDVATQTLTIASVEDPYTRGGGGVNDLVLSALTGGEAMSGFLSTSLFGSAVSTTVSITDGDVSIAVVRLRRYEIANG